MAPKKTAAAKKTVVSNNVQVKRLKTKNEELKKKLKEAEADLETEQNELTRLTGVTAREHAWTIQLEERRAAYDVYILNSARESHWQMKRQLSNSKRTKASLEKKQLKQLEEIDELSKSVGAKYEILNAEKYKVNDKRTEMRQAHKVLLKAQERAERAPRQWKTCEVCAEKYTGARVHCPRVLECGHTICAKCIKTMIEPCESFFCPFDRHGMMISKRAVDFLPKNLILLGM